MQKGLFNYYLPFLEKTKKFFSIFLIIKLVLYVYFLYCATLFVRLPMNVLETVFKTLTNSKGIDMLFGPDIILILCYSLCNINITTYVLSVNSGEIRTNFSNVNSLKDKIIKFFRIRDNYDYVNRSEVLII